MPITAPWANASKAYYSLLERECGDLLSGEPKSITIFCAPGEQSKVSGQKKENRRKLAARLFGSEEAVGRIRIRADGSLSAYTLRIKPE